MGIGQFHHIPSPHPPPSPISISSPVKPPAGDKSHPTETPASFNPTAKAPNPKMTDGLGLECQVCGFVGLDDGSDGFFYCQRCGSQADGIRDTAVDDDEMLLTKENVGGIVQRRVAMVKPEPLSQSQPPSQFWETLRTQENDDDDDDGVGPTEPIDFGRGPRTLSYEDYYSEIRMRYVMGVQIMIELQVKALVEKFNVCPIIVDMVEPIWLRFVASTKLFSDDWADEVINESESQVQGETEAVAPNAKHKSEPHNILGKRSVMIWYRSTITLYFYSEAGIISCFNCSFHWIGITSGQLLWSCCLESLAASIAHSIGKWEKGLVKRKDGKESKILDKTAESESESESECKMSSLSNNLVSESYDKRLPKQSNLDATEILLLLESKYSQLIDKSDQIIEDLWNYYHKEEEDHKPSSPSSNCGSHKRPFDFTETNMKKLKKSKDENDDKISNETQKEKAIRRMISNMEEKRFCYIPPRTKIKRPDDYLHYTRKKDDGNYTYASHVDYYILLRSCARVGRLDVRVMHGAVLSFERRLAWLEKNIDQCVKEMPSFQVSCELCPQDDMNGDESMDFSKLNL
ncbi:unnamed protein product [Lactuca saligna]|uniref:RRN7-type domain-containing protein n=1 Tax=Lactuca saligna TaxID=75948 RepID=A0AA35V3T4_LACSI|nr:unnamed protein product [Lactuca saligna]